MQDDLSALKQSLSTTASVTHYHNGTATLEKRNAFVDARVALANLAYIQFISDLTADKQQLDTATDMLLLGLNLLGSTTASGVRAKANLAAIAAGVTGSKAVVDKHYYYEKTTSALVTTMNARRKEVMLRILEGVRKPLDVYTFTQALADIHNYYSAGTLINAIAAVQGDASARETKADEQLRNFGELPVRTDDEINQIRAATRVVLATIKGGDISAIKALLKKLGLDGLPQATLEEARVSLRANFQKALETRPELVVSVGSQLP